MAVAVIAALVAGSSPVASVGAAGVARPLDGGGQSSGEVHHDTSPQLRDIPAVAVTSRSHPAKPIPRVPGTDTGQSAPSSAAGVTPNAAIVGLDFAGIGNGFTGPQGPFTVGVPRRQGLQPRPGQDAHWSSRDAAMLRCRHQLRWTARIGLVRLPATTGRLPESRSRVGRCSRPACVLEVPRRLDDACQLDTHRPTTLATAAFAEACVGGTCIPQSGTTQKTALRPRPIEVARPSTVRPASAHYSSWSRRSCSTVSSASHDAPRTRPRKLQEAR